jgi:hypothetical protein
MDEAPELALPVIRGMREWDRAEIFAMQPDDDLTRFTEMVQAFGPAAWISGVGYEPIACFGAYQAFPGLFEMWMFATDNINSIGKSMTKAVRDVIVPHLFACGARRLECRSMEGHVEAQRWLETVGARRESSAPEFGRGGQTFHTYVWERR